MAMSLLLLDETAGDLPVRDSSPKRSVQDVSAIAHPTKARGLKTRMRASVARTRQQVSQMSQAELEDGFLRLHDENLVLKEFACKQEDRIKRLGSKLLRLTHERAQGLGKLGSRARWSGRELEREASLEELQERVWDLEQRNEGLRSRLLFYRQQLLLHGCRRPGPYSSVQARVDTGLRRAHTASGRVPERRPRGMRVRGPKARPTHTAPPSYSQHIAEGAAAHTEQIHVPPSPSTTEGTAAPESQLLVLAELQPESQHLAWGREMDFGEALSQQQQALEHRATVRRNVDLIRLQRLLQERSCELAMSRGRFAELHEAYESQLQQKQEMARSTSEALLGQVEELTLQLKAERQKVRALESQKQSISSLQGALEEFQERIRHLEKERDLLKEDYDALLESRLACEQRWGDVSRLEEQLSLVLTEKQQLAEELAQERDLIPSPARSTALQQEEERGVTLAGQSSVQMPEPALPQPPSLAQLPFQTEQEELPSQQSLRRRLQESEVAHADTILELEKTRDMLILQHRINRDYQAELQGVLMQAERDMSAHEEKQQKMEQLLDLRGAHIHQLEEQLKVMAYGRQQLRLQPTECSMAVEEEKTPLLRHGENLLELHIAGAVLSQEALQLLGEAQPLTFCTYAFYDFETHCTPVVCGAQPRYCFTSQYVVRAEPLFLQYLQEAAARLDLHVATAADHRTLASCWLRFGEGLGSGERVCATAVLHGQSGEDCGMLEYWMRLRPKTLGYFPACLPWARAAQRSRQQELEGGPEQLWNELQVQIRGCAGLRGRWLGSPPSPYAMYRFFTFPDHDTPIVPSSSHPCFGDLRTFPLRPTTQLSRYLWLESLHVYVFDDEDAEAGCYLGKAQIPLLPLARGHSITGDFVLTDPAGHPNGSVSLSLEWKRPYLPPGLAWASENQRTSPLEQLLENGRAVQPSQVTPAAREAQAGEEEADHAAEDGESLARGQHLEPRSLGSAPQDTARVEACEPALDSDAQTTDSDEIVVGTRLGSPPKAGIRIEIVSLRLHPTSEVMASKHVQQLYVEFHFPGVPLAETETPLSLRKPQSGEEIYFHFSKVIPLDPERVSTQRKLLFSMLQAEVAGQNWLQFVVVSEPLPGTRGECEDVGFAYLDLREILLSGSDVLEQELEVVSPQDHSAIGRLTVSMEAAAALRDIYWEGRRKAEEEE